MLSLGSRDEGRKVIGLGLGFRSREEAMEENELEEGEAFSGHEDDACIDPDITLSYIDEKLQDVLGHFQKDFEGGVSAENLGAKFGGYGSFLPAYQRSPSILSQPKSPPRPPNHTVSKSPYNSSVECVQQNPSVSRGTSVFKNNTASIAQPNNSSRKDNCISSASAGSCVPHLDSDIKPINLSDQKSLKVRIKVGPDNTLARSNAAIYSGLGLDTSPSSSPEDSLDASPGLYPEFRDAPGESPLSILQAMTCFSVPGGRLLSPLHADMFQLIENESLCSRKSGILGNGVLNISAVPDMTLSMREMKGFSDKKIKSDEKNNRSIEEENLYCKGDMANMLKKEMDIDTPASKRVVSSVLNLPLQACSRTADLKTEQQITGDLVKGSSRVLSTSNELNKPSGKDRLSLPDSAKDDQFIPMGSVKSGGVGNLGNGTTQSKGKLNSKTSFEKNIDERNPSNHKDISSDTRREEKTKNHKSYDISKLNGDVYKSRNDHVPGHAEPMKQMLAQKVISHEKDAEKILQRNDHLHGGKRRQKGSHNNGAPSVESIQTQGNLKAASSLVPKEKKKSSHGRGDHSEKKSKMMKSRKETSKGHSRGSQREVVGNVNEEKVENRANLPEPFISTDKLMERSGVKKDVNLQPEPMANPPVFTSSMSAAPTSDAAGALDPPPAVLINENWVCCDICQTWRLLPYGHDPNNLPKKWKCSMQEWLPGLNKCFISEEETTKAFNALYLVPAPETGVNLNGHQAVAASSSTTADAKHFGRRFDHDMQSVPTTGKKKSGLVGASNIANNSVSKKNLQAAVTSRSLIDVGEYPLETNSSIKAGLGITSKSTDFTTEKYNHKQKEKHEIPGRYSDGGDLMGKGGKHSKLKSKREANQDGLRASKKIKKENFVEDQLSDLDVTGKLASGVDSGLSAKVTGKILQNYSDHSSSKDSKSEQRGNLAASIKKSKRPAHVFSNGDFRDPFSASNVEKSGTLDYAAKKRKVKEWQESQTHQETIMTPQHTLDSRLSSKEAFSEGDLRKQKKAKVSKSERKESSMSNVDGKTDKKGWSTRILLSDSRGQRYDGMGEVGRVGRKEQTGYQETSVSRQALDGNYPSKRDLSYVQLPTAATSSSSKVSSSRRSKANLQEARGSPVESVSSSPLRTSAPEKISIRRSSEAKGDMVNLDPSFMGSPKKSSDGELGSDQSGTQRKELGSVQLKSLESNRVLESGGLGSMEGTGHYRGKETNHLSGGNNNGLYLKRGVQVNPIPAEFEGTNVIGDTENILDHVDKYILDGPEKDNTDDDRINLSNHLRLNGTSQRKSDKSSYGFKERNRSSNPDANGGKLKVSDSLSDRKELYSTKNGSNFRSEADFNFNDNSIRHEDLRDENCNFQEIDDDYLGKKNPSAKWSRFDRREENHSNNGVDENLNAQNRDFNLKPTAGGASSKSNLLENLQLAPYPSENPVSHSLSNRNDRSDMASGRGASQPVQPPKDKSEAQSLGPQKIPTPIKGSRSDTYPIDTANRDAVKLAKQSRKPDSQNGVHASSLRQGILNGHDSSPMRKDGPSVANVVLKEARDLKHTANRLKGEGLAHESIGLYFEAAMKFLYGASLLESSSAECAKHGEMSPSMMMYFDTAKLCEYCAHEYERYKEMAAAALAYKCVEVAYMKVAYFKHPAAIKDRHELQMTHQTILPGESPSSSASDVDNLNNQGALDKAASAKATGSPHIAGNHVVARNRPADSPHKAAFERLLSYTCDLNCAFDATKRSQNAIAAASVNTEKDGIDGISSVRKVLDFNFHNVEELLRLVRLSVESISH